MSSSTKSTKTVTIQKRGHFNDDSFFKDAWDEWDQAMRDAVDRWEKKSSDTTTTKRTTYLTPSTPSKETHTVYRQIRSSNVMADESQAVSCTEEDDKYRMVMDVKDFSPEHINVKAIDDTIVVEGHIEKKEGNAVSTQKFVRRFLLPPGALPSSKTETSIPISRGSETITSRVMGGSPRRHVVTTWGQAAGKPSDRDRGPFNPTGGCNTTYYSTPKGTARVTETIYVDVPDRRGNTVSTTTDHSNQWRSFNTMVEQSQKEMEDMMKHHTIDSSTSKYPNSTSKNVVSVPIGASTTRDVTRSGNSVTERQEHRWGDKPAPGVNRTNRALSEATEVKDKDGNVIGHKLKSEKESKAEGEREEVLPDGTKRKIFTKSYETKNTFSSSSNNFAKTKL
ncbi:Heat shock protein 26 [Armadillidium vulgare]|nr:Heat shock protein 26 [Armadillidium vulgare]